MSQFTRLSTLLLTAALAACSGDGAVPVASDAAAPSVAASISDGAHGATAYDRHFFFLPPMVANPDATGVFDRALAPVVTICEYAGGACVAPVATFTTTSGPGSERVRAGDDHYIANWHTRDFVLDVAKTYRISVSVNGLELGHADVDLVATARDLKSVSPSDVGLVRGSSLPIKFRIEGGIAARVEVAPASATVYKGDGQAFTATVYDLHDQPITTAVTWASSDVGVAQVSSSGQATSLSLGTTTITAAAERASGTAMLTVIPRPVASIEVSPVTASIPQGQTKSFTAIVKDDAGNVLTGEAITWTITGAPSGTATLSTTSGYTTVATGVTPGTATITASTGGKSASATLAVVSLCSLSGLFPFGSAAAVPGPPCALRLTPAWYSQAGGAWSNTKIKVVNGFETEFTFRMSGPGGACDGYQCGADGIAFVVQGMSGTTVGGLGGGIGYDGISSSLAVEFDSWYNGGYPTYDPNSNHIAVHTGGSGPNSVSHSGIFEKGTAVVPGDFNDGVSRNVKIVYVPGTLQIFVDGVLRLTSAVDFTNLNGANILDADGKAWVGFTAATGAAFANHDILNWTFSGAP